MIKNVFPAEVLACSSMWIPHQGDTWRPLDFVQTVTTVSDSFESICNIHDIQRRACRFSLASGAVYVVNVFVSTAFNSFCLLSTTNFQWYQHHCCEYGVFSFFTALQHRPARTKFAFKAQLLTLQICCGCLQISKHFLVCDQCTILYYL